MIRNCFGKRIKNEDVIADKSFLKSDGSIDWNLLQNADDNGFDKGKIIKDGKYIIEDYVIPKSTRIIRYGRNSGQYTAPHGTLYEELSLPYIKESRAYHEYIVRKDCKVDCVVTKGFAARGFNVKGGVVQFYHKGFTIEELIKSKVLKEDYRWLIKAIFKM